MSAIAFPDFLEDPSEFSMSLAVNQRSFASPEGGSEQVIDRLNDRWVASAVLVPRTHDDAAEVEAWIASMRGMANTVALYHLVRPWPRGTMRGAPTAQAASIAMRSIVINTTAGATLLAGDMVGVAGLLLQVASNAIANGAGTMVVPIVNALRKPVAAGSPVAWDRPSAPFRFASKPAVQYLPGYAAEISMDFVEAIG